VKTVHTKFLNQTQTQTKARRPLPLLRRILSAFSRGTYFHSPWVLRGNQLFPMEYRSSHNRRSRYEVWYVDTLVTTTPLVYRLRLQCSSTLQYNTALQYRTAGCAIFKSTQVPSKLNIRSQISTRRQNWTCWDSSSHVQFWWVFGLIWYKIDESQHFLLGWN